MWTTLTAASGLVVLDGRLLMIRQRRPYGVFWEMPSGYYEPNESLEQTAAREVAEPRLRPQAEEGISAAEFVEPARLSGVHPLEQPVLDRWWAGGETGFYVHADVDVLPDGTQDYRFRP